MQPDGQYNSGRTLASTTRFALDKCGATSPRSVRKGLRPQEVHCVSKGRSQRAQLPRSPHMSTGVLDVVLAGLLAALVVLLANADSQPWQVYALDLAACAAAACASRWPRIGGIALGVVLAIYVAIPAEWATMGEYAPLIPILTSGMAGLRRQRTVMSVAYLVLLTAIALHNAPSVANAMLGAVVWAALIGVLWLIGSSFHTVTQAYESARQADRVLQRERMTLALHDTVARSLTLMVMDSELGRLRGDEPADVAARLTAGAERALQDVRLIMAILHEPTNADLDVSAAADTPLGDALRAGVHDLRERGMAVTTAIEGELDSLTAAESSALGPAAAEAIHNMIKHADPTQSCAIVIEISHETAKATFVNGVRDEPESSADRMSHGLWGMTQRLRLVGGDVSTNHNSSQWITTIQLPREVAAQPRPQRGGSGGVLATDHSSDS